MHRVQCPYSGGPGDEGGGVVMAATTRWKSIILGLRRDARGVAAAEFALIAPILAALLFGVFNIGNLVYQQSVLQQALRAGGLYALSFPTQTGALNSPNSGIAMAIMQALPPTWTDANPTAVLSPAPPAGPPYYITMTVTRPYAWFQSAIPTALAGPTTSYVVRVQ